VLGGITKIQMVHGKYHGMAVYMDAQAKAFILINTNTNIVHFLEIFIFVMLCNYYRHL